MTIRDMIDSGIELCGNVLIREMNQDTGDAVRENILSLALKEQDELLDREIRYVYPPHFDWDAWNYCFEVAAKEDA